MPRRLTANIVITQPKGEHYVCANDEGTRDHTTTHHTTPHHVSRKGQNHNQQQQMMGITVVAPANGFLEKEVHARW